MLFAAAGSDNPAGDDPSLDPKRGQRMAIQRTLPFLWRGASGLTGPRPQRSCASQRPCQSFEDDARSAFILPKLTADGQMVLLLKPFELLDKLSPLIPPPRRHPHHYHGVLAPKSPLRSKIASLANKEISSAPFSGGCPASAINCQEEPKVGIGQKTLISPPPNQSPEIVDEMQDRPKDKKQPSKASLFRWAMLLPPQRSKRSSGTPGARIFEVFPLFCPKCNHPMRIISFIQDEHSIRKVLTHLNEPIQPPPTLRRAELVHRADSLRSSAPR